SLRQVSLHKQRKVARAVTARKLLILMSAKERRVKTRPTGFGGTAGGSRPALRGCCRQQEEQGQLAALAPSSGASRHLLPQAGEGLFGGSPRRREQGCSAGFPQAGAGPGCSQTDS